MASLYNAAFKTRKTQRLCHISSYNDIQNLRSYSVLYRDILYIDILSSIFANQALIVLVISPPTSD